MSATADFSDYVVYVDESGDHNLTSINPKNPVFVLAFCIFSKDDYRTRIVPEAQRLKFDFWGHDGVILHNHEIRKAHGDFSILLNGTTRGAFMARLTEMIDAIPMTIIASVIDKPSHVRKYSDPSNPYEISLGFCMERLHRWLGENGQGNKLTHVIVERRGQPEDDALELQFRRVADGANYDGTKMPFLDIRFMDKKNNSTGLQIADLVAYPIGRHCVDPTQPNRAYDVVERKIRRSSSGKISGYGLKVFP